MAFIDRLRKLTEDAIKPMPPLAITKGPKGAPEPSKDRTKKPDDDAGTDFGKLHTALQAQITKLKSARDVSDSEFPDATITKDGSTIRIESEATDRSDKTFLEIEKAGEGKYKVETDKGKRGVNPEGIFFSSGEVYGGEDIVKAVTAFVDSWTKVLNSK